MVVDKSTINARDEAERISEILQLAGLVDTSTQHDKITCNRRESTMKSILNIAASLAMIAFASPAMAEDGALSFILVTQGQANDTFWNVVKNGALAAGKEVGANVEYRSPETFDMVAMGQLIDAAVNQKPDGIAVSIPDGDALGPSIQRAREAGIAVVSIVNGGDVHEKVGSMVHIGQDEHLAGIAAGKKLKELGAKKGICINVEPGNVSLDLRCQGFAEGLEGPVTTIPTSLDPSENVSKIRAALETDPTIDAVLGTSAPFSGEPAVTAVAELGKKDSVHVATFDLSPSILQSIADGDAEFAVDQQQYLDGYMAVIFLKAYKDTGVMPVGQVLTGPRLVTADTAKSVLELSAAGLR